MRKAKRTLTVRVSHLLRRHRKKDCRRDLVQSDYDELCWGNGDRCLFPRQDPIISIPGVRHRPVIIFQIFNKDTATNQRPVASKCAV
jgi:hypothetical protein